MKKTVLILIGALLMSVIFVACRDEDNSSSENSSGSTENITWGAASLGSNAQVIATAISDIVNNEAEGINMSVQATGGSSENPRLMQNEEIDIAHATEAYNATKGIENFDGEEPTELWALFSMYSNEFVWLVMEDSDIETVEDLEGKKVSIGPPGSGTTVMSEVILEAYDIEVDESNLGYDESVDALKDGVVDAIGNFSSSGIPSPSLEQLDQSASYRVLPMDEDVLDIAYQEYPDYSESIIPKDSFKGIKEDFPTFASFSIEYADSRMSDDVAYEIVKELYENKDKLESYHQLAGKMDEESALDGIPEDVPVHPGAAKYFKEIGVWDDDLSIGER